MPLQFFETPLNLFNDGPLSRGVLINNHRLFCKIWFQFVNKNEFWCIVTSFVTTLGCNPVIRIEKN